MEMDYFIEWMAPFPVSKTSASRSTWLQCLWHGRVLSTSVWLVASGEFPLFLSVIHLPEFRCLQSSCKISWDCKQRITLLRNALIFKAIRNIAVLEVVCFLSQNIVFSPFTLFTWLLLTFCQVLVILVFILCPVTHS